jgi:hypothetical protein
MFQTTNQFIMYQYIIPMFFPDGTSSLASSVSAMRPGLGSGDWENGGFHRHGWSTLRSQKKTYEFLT